MRKIMVIFLLMAIVMIFASCGDSNQEITTTLNTSVSISTTQESTTEELTYILTTSPDKTAPWSETTRFEISTTVEALTDNYGDITFTTGDVSRPEVITSMVPTVVTTTTSPATTTATTTEATTTATTTKATTQTTTATTTQAVEKKPVALSIYSTGTNEDEVILEIDDSNWSGDIKANTKNIAIKVDGVTLETTAECKVSSKKNADGRYEIVVDLSGADISSDANVSFTIPENFIVTKNGAQYNTAYSTTVGF